MSDCAILRRVKDMRRLSNRSIDGVWICLLTPFYITLTQTCVFKKAQTQTDEWSEALRFQPRRQRQKPAKCTQWNEWLHAWKLIRTGGLRVWGRTLSLIHALLWQCSTSAPSLVCSQRDWPQKKVEQACRTVEFVRSSISLRRLQHRGVESAGKSAVFNFRNACIRKSAPN